MLKESRNKSFLLSRLRGSAGQRAGLVILGATLCLAIVFIEMGGVFDKTFWLEFLPGLMSNLVIFALAVLVIDRMLQKERWNKLEQLNARRSSFVRLQANVLAFWLLEYLGISIEREKENGKELTYEFAIERLKLEDVSTIFARTFMTSDNRQKFVSEFVNGVKKRLEGMSKELEDIYPHPDPSILKLIDEMFRSLGAISVIGEIQSAIEKTNKKMSAKHRFEPEQVQVLMDLALQGPSGTALTEIASSLVEISSRAKSNNLFASAD